MALDMYACMCKFVILEPMCSLCARICSAHISFYLCGWNTLHDTFLKRDSLHQTTALHYSTHFNANFALERMIETNHRECVVYLETVVISE